jgi:hypothetical protein
VVDVADGVLAAALELVVSDGEDAEVELSFEHADTVRIAAAARLAAVIALRYSVFVTLVAPFSRTGPAPARCTDTRDSDRRALRM